MITFLLCLLASIVFYKLGKTFSHEPQSVMVPREYRKAAQHAADTSMQQQVVVFDGSTYDILKANNQHAARGNIVFVASPGDIEKSIKVGDCISMWGKQNATR